MSDDKLRSQLFADIPGRKQDKAQRSIIAGITDELDFEPLDELMISRSAWEHVSSLKVDPKIVFAHPDVLVAHPTTSLHYRGMALLCR